MDTPLPFAPAAASPEAAPAIVFDDLPWELEPVELAPVRPASKMPPRKIRRAPRPAAPERLHWPVIVFTAVTACLLVFATRADDRAHTWEFPAEQAR